MKNPIHIGLVFAISFAAATTSVSAQSFPGGLGMSLSGGATGAQFRETDNTLIQSWQDVTPGNITQEPGNTFTTGPGTRNAGDFNGPDAPQSTVGELAINSGMNLPIPSGEYSFGFPTGYAPYRGERNDPGAAYDYRLPLTSLGSVDFDIVDR